MARKGLKVSTASAAPTSWSVADFGVFYTENAAELRAHATRILKDTNRAEEVVQDALIKFMLAAPELSSAEHALGYLHRTIENLCVDIFRLEGRRPNLVVLDDAQAEIEANWIDNEDHADVISAADDAAIIRQALALLSPAERTALVMWEMEGIKESAVRHTLSRARASMRRILTEIVIDEERGLTALDMLSTTYKRAGEIAKKSSSVALSLVLVMAAFLGFNSMTGNESNIASTKIVAQAPAKPAAPSASETAKTPTAPADVAPTAEAVAEAVTEQTPLIVNETTDAQKFQTFSNQVAAAKEMLTLATPNIFPGLNANGIPVGLSVNDGSDYIGNAVIHIRPGAVTTQATVVTESSLMTNDPKAINVLIHQYITYTGLDLQYAVTPSVRIKGVWADLKVTGTSSNVKTLADGSKLITVYIVLDTEKTESAGIAMPAFGRDANRIPPVILTVIHTNATGQEIYGQAVQVLDPLDQVGGAI
jgi:DNA-directed RNA polymerase specialized sigma24 family protein